MSSADLTRQNLRLISQILGWIYTISWSLSFYPQPITNWNRRSTVGTSVDYPLLNVFGFVCYTISITVFLFSPTVRSQYASRHPLATEPTARFNDFAFGAHALVITAICYSQYFQWIWGFEMSKSQRISRPVIIFMSGCALAVVIVAGLIVVNNGLVHQDPTTWAWIDLAYAFGNIKLIATFSKYVPQAVLNYQLKSTVGWSIGAILLDVIGGFMSLAQLFIDAGLQGRWSGVYGNPVKLGLAIVSLAFDFIFLGQHYILYRHPEDHVKVRKDTTADENAPLLGAV